VVYEALNQPGPTFVYHAEEPGGRAAVNRALDDAGFQVAAVRAEGDGVLASEPIIDIAGVRKSFGRTTALDGLTMQVAEGRVAALLGANGAGKTTLVRILATLLAPDAGRVTVAGIDVVRRPVAVRHVIGLAGQHAAVDQTLTGRENLVMIARLYRLPAARARQRSAEVLERLSLTEAADRPVRTYSGGMRRRLDVGASLVGQPRVLLLDEPSAGLDPAARLELRSFLRGLVAQGATLLLTTQQLEEADHLADAGPGGEDLLQGTAQRHGASCRGPPAGRGRDRRRGRHGPAALARRRLHQRPRPRLRQDRGREAGMSTPAITARPDRLPAAALLTDTLVITRRNLTRTRRTPQTAVAAVTSPVLFLILFVSNAFIPVATLPRWLQGFAANQPVSVFDNALRALTQGPGAAPALGHDATYLVVAAIAWCAGIANVFTAITLRLYRRM
jgi:ABC-type Na+ transport system ATPase subunit NatA